MGTRVFFIGGFRASKKDVDDWSASAASQRSDVDFQGFPWPASAWHVAKDEPVVNAVKGDGTLAKIIKVIAAAKDDVVFIVGHSSGCAIANAVDEGLKYTGNINLISLDGFRPYGAARQRPSTQMWSARNGDSVSLNYPQKGNLDGRLKVYTAQNCTNVWSLHFSMVNTAVSDDLVKGQPDIPKGYKGCRANLCWLGTSQ